MDNGQLKKYLLEQKQPLDQAVEKKLAYLKSDEIFLDPFADWKLSKSNVEKDLDDMAFEEAFGIVENQSFSTTHNVTQPVNQSQASQDEAPARAPMSMAERIALLRGSSMSVVQSVRPSHKK